MCLDIRYGRSEVHSTASCISSCVSLQESAKLIIADNIPGVSLVLAVGRILLDFAA